MIPCVYIGFCDHTLTLSEACFLPLDFVYDLNRVYVFSMSSPTVQIVSVGRVRSGTTCHMRLWIDNDLFGAQ